MPLVVTDGGKAGKSSDSRSSSSRSLRRSNTIDVEKVSERTISARKEKQRAMTHSLNELIICAICLEQLRRPTMLPCQHTFCLHCLQNFVKHGSLLITCPTCRLEVLIPPEGVGALPTNILLQAFLESIKPDSGAKAATALAVTSKKSGLSCSQCSTATHSATLTLCEHCTQVFCSSCHLAHNNQLRTQWHDVFENLLAEDHRLSLLLEESRVRRKKLAENIEAAIGIQVQQLFEKQDHLLTELKAWCEAEDARLAEIQKLCRDVLSEQPPKSAIADSDSVPNLDLLKRAATRLFQARLCGNARLTFNDEELALSRQSIGEPAEVDESSSLSGAGTADRAEAQADVEPIVQLRERKGEPTNREGRRVTFHSMPSQESFDSQAADEQSVFYRSKSSNPRMRIVSGVLQRPAGVAVSPWTGDIYVAATDSHRVYVLDKNGKIVKSLGSSYRSGDGGSGGVGGGGSGGAPHVVTTAVADSSSGTFLCPFGISFSTVAEEIYVTDKWLNCIQVFNKDGAFVRSIGAKGTSAGHFRSPEGIAVDPKGYIYVCDTCNDRVQILDRNGIYVRELGLVSQLNLPDGKHYLKREFNEPTGVTISPDGSKVAVCDSGNCRIKIFNALTGERTVVFGYKGAQRGQFQQPESLVMDDKGFVIVGDNGNGRIQIFRSNGNFVRALGSKGSGPGQFNWISGLAINKERDIIVTDFKNHNIQIF